MFRDPKPILTPCTGVDLPKGRNLFNFRLTNRSRLSNSLMIEARYSCINADADPGLRVFLRYLPKNWLLAARLSTSTWDTSSRLPAPSFTHRSTAKCYSCNDVDGSVGLRLFEIASVLVRFDHVASFIVNANSQYYVPLPSCTVFSPSRAQPVHGCFPDAFFLTPARHRPPASVSR
jgi:hypothetical protein